VLNVHACEGVHYCVAALLRCRLVQSIASHNDNNMFGYAQAIRTLLCTAQQ